MALAYNISGKGEVVLWIHGFCEDGRIWEEYIVPFNLKYRNIVVDLPGYGQSANLTAPTQIDAMAQAVKNLLDQENITLINIVGHSMGGYVALAMAELYPGLVKKMCLFHSQPFADDDAKVAARRKTKTFIEKNGLKPWMEEFYPSLFAEKNKKACQPVIEKLIGRGIQYPIATVINSIDAMIARPDRSKVLQNFVGPVLFIVGKEDKAIPEKNSLGQLDLPDISFAEMLGGVAHMGIFEAPDETKKAIDELLNYAQ